MATQQKSQYEYKARKEDGSVATGSVEAVSEKQAVRMIRSRGWLLVSIKEKREGDLTQLIQKFEKVKSDDVVGFTRQLSTMVGAGLPLTEALSILEVQSSQAMSRLVTEIRQEVEAGNSLSDALEESGSDVFSKVYIALVRAGESAGVLDEILMRLANNMEKQREFKQNIKGAMIYPIIVLVGMVVVGIIMMIFVVPKMTAMYKDFGATLPLPTQILIGLSDFLVNFWYILVILVGGLAYFVYKWSKTEVGALLIEKAIFDIPIIGPLRKKVILAEFARTMSLLIGAGISILEALRIVSDAVGSRIIRMRLEEAAGEVEKGRPLGIVLAKFEEFPPILPQMLSVGEQTGQVAEILTRIADYFEQESEVGVNALSTAIEPIIIVIMGIGVLFLVMAVIMPIYNLTSQF